MQSIHIDPDACIACTTCTVFCPVAAATGEFPGPRMIGPAYERFRLQGLADDASLSYCSNCKNCDISCPQGVDIAAINMVARARQYEQQHPHFLRDWIVSHSETLAHLIGFVPAVVKNTSLKNPLVRQCLDLIGIAKGADMPSYAPKRFRTLLAAMKQPQCKQKIAFFPGCYVDLYDPQAGLDLVWALNQAGYEVVSSDDFVCCGVPMIANGFMKDGRKNAQRNLEVIKKFKEQGIEVMSACPSCELMFREELPTFFPDLSAEWPGMVDAQELLLNLYEEGKLKLDLDLKKAQPIMYHAPCHMRALGIGLPGYSLLQAVGLDVRAANAGCCGISGSYGFKKEKFSVSRQVGSALFTTIEDSGVAQVATECGTCRLQIGSVTKKQVQHPISVIRALAKN